MAAKPIVDGIESEHKGALTVIRIDIQDPETRPIQARYGFEFTPLFVLIDGNGTEIWRTVGMINPEDVRRSLANQQ
jgi:hypothetical protein